MRSTKIFLTIMAAAIFALAAYAGYFLASAEPLEKPPAVTTHTEPPPAAATTLECISASQVCWQHRLACVKRQTLTIPATTTAQDLAADYPPYQWQITKQDDHWQALHLTDGLCSEHQEIRHLGANQSGQYLAVLYGPATVGSDGGAYRVTDILLETLDDQFRAEILAGKWEIYSEEELIGLLDGISEQR